MYIICIAISLQGRVIGRDTGEEGGEEIDGIGDQPSYPNRWNHKLMETGIMDKELSL